MVIVISTQTNIQTDRQTDGRTYGRTDGHIHFIRRILMYKVIQNSLQYNAHDSGYFK